MQLRALLLCGLLVCTCAGSTFPAGAAPPSTGASQLVGSVGGNITAVATSGDYAYIIQGAALTVLDVRVPSRPHPVGSVVFASPVTTMQLLGRYALVTTTEPRLWSVDLQDSTNPMLCGYVVLPSEVYKLYTAGNKAYFVVRFRDLYTLDLANPATPALRGSAALPEQTRVFEIAEDRMYVGLRTAQLNVVDRVQVFQLGIGIAPQLLATVPVPSIEPLDLQVQGTLVVLFGVAGAAGSDKGVGTLRSFDAGDLRRPPQVGSITLANRTLELAVSESFAYANIQTDQSHLLQTIDLSDPAQPQVRGAVPLGQFAYNLQIAGALAFINVYTPSPRYDVELTAVKLDDADTPVVAGRFPQKTDAVFVADGRAYYPSGASVKTLDLADRDRVTALGNYASWYAYDLDVFGSTACLVTYRGVQLLHVTDPVAPQLQGSYTLAPGERAVQAWMTNGVIYLATTSVVTTELSYLRTIDSTDTNALRPLGSVAISGTIYALQVANGRGYVGTDSGWHLIDVSNALSPTLLATVPLSRSFVRDIAAMGQQVYVLSSGSEDTSKLQVWTTTEPTSPTLQRALPLPGVANSLVVSGTLAYVSYGRYTASNQPAEDSRLGVIDIGGAVLSVRSSLVLPDGGGDVQLVGNVAYIVGEASTLQVIDVRDPQLPRWLGAAGVNRPQHLSIANGMAYVTDANGSFSILRIDPSAFTSVWLPLVARSASSTSYLRFVR